MSRDSGERVTYKSRVKRKAFSLPTSSRFSHKNSLSSVYLLDNIAGTRIVEQLFPLSKTAMSE